MGTMVSQLKISPLAFEECWNAGVLTTETVNVVSKAIKEMSKAMKDAAANVQTDENGEPVESNVPALIDNSAIAKQIKLGDVFHGS